jgi:hypothetical protein
MSLLPLVRIWIVISVLASAAGWILSTVGGLNRIGYLAFFALGVAVWFGIRKWIGRETLKRVDEKLASTDTPLKPGANKTKQGLNWPKVRWRFRHGLPGCFAALTFLIFLGGVLYAPSTHTALTYRIPRVLQWLTEGKWFWIHTSNFRMNDRACGIEWLSAPLLLFFRSDRLLFLLNFVPFLLLPGLIFSVCRRLGVCGRVAWQWMWLLPTGYNFLLEAGSAGNDTFPTVYALAAVDFALRAWESRRASDFWLSIFSAGLLTGAKASNLPLLLPWGILALALWPIVKRKLIAMAVVGLVAALVSFLPTAALNYRYLSDWSGLKLENAGMNMKNPIVGIWGNALLFLLHNFVPPFFPAAGWWNQSALSILPRAIVAPMVANFEDGFHKVGEMPTEDWAGLGLGVSLLMVATVIGGVCAKRAGAVGQGRPGELPRTVRRLVLLAPWAALLAYCVKTGMVTGARLISPYYPLLLPWLIIGSGQSNFIRTKVWRGLVWFALLLAFPVLISTPPRPLWPAKTVLSKLAQWKPDSRAISRALGVYTVYRERPDPMPQVRGLLPEDAITVGFLGTPDDMDMSLWLPLGTRTVKHLLLSDTDADIRRRGIHYALVSEFCLQEKRINPSEWRERTGAELINTLTVTQKLAEGAQVWELVRFR